MTTFKIGKLTTYVLLAFSLMFGLAACSGNGSEVVSSPNGRIAAHVQTADDGRVFYTVERDNSAVIDTSYLGLTLRNGAIGKNAVLKKVTPISADETWTTVWGEESKIRNHYNGAIYEFEEQGGTTPRKFSVELRVFDDGVGFRYLFPEDFGADGDVVITDETTEFNLPADATAWSLPWDTPYYEAIWNPAPVNALDTVLTPLTLKTPDGLYMAVHEAALTDYAEMNLARDGKDGSARFTSYLTPLANGNKVETNAPFSTPWRTVILADNAGDLMLSRMMLNLNEPCAIEDTSWIEPGRYIGIWWGMHKNDWTWEMEGSDKHGATTENTKRYIDFAADHGFNGVLVEGWNKGWAGDWSANGDQFDFTTPYPDYDLQYLADYARSKGVRLIGHNETGGAAANYEAQLDTAFRLYNQLGINAVKTGYVNPLMDHKELHGSQYGVRHYRKVIEEAARNHIMIDNHEPVMPTGLQRTWPNLMTQEGVRGGEWDAFSRDGGNPAEHAVTLPFTRGLAGPMDYTPGIFNYENKSVPGTRPHTTIAKQLAMTMILYSPLQMAADQIENYEGRPEFEFITECPTTWDQTLIPEAEIGEYITMVRKERSGDRWFVASMSGANPHQYDLKLDFLDADKKYTAKIFADGEGADGEDNPYPVEISSMEVDSTSTLPLNLVRSGGAAVILTPM